MLKDLMTHKIDKLEFFIAIEKSTGLMLKKAESYSNNSPQRLWLHSSEVEARKAIAFVIKSGLTRKEILNLKKRELNDLIEKDYTIEKFIINSNIAQINITPEGVR
jgi:hypothetical protein